VISNDLLLLEDIPALLLELLKVCLISLSAGVGIAGAGCSVDTALTLLELGGWDFGCIPFFACTANFTLCWDCRNLIAFFGSFLASEGVVA